MKATIQFRQINRYKGNGKRRIRESFNYRVFQGNKFVCSVFPCPGGGFKIYAKDSEYYSKTRMGVVEQYLKDFPQAAELSTPWDK